MISDTELPHFTCLATPEAQVSAFCRAVISNVVPFKFLGESNSSGENWKVLMRHVHEFIKLRRSETFTLADVLPNIKVSKLWCFRTGDVNAMSKPMAQTDFLKCSELLAELMYWIFDSLLIPLIRCNFYVTESATHRNRVFYFRHDAWQRMANPAREDLKTRMLAPMEHARANEVLEGRTLGYSQVRLMPKDRGMRPISNLRRRMPIVRNGVKTLSKSINSLMTPVFNVMNLEKVNRSKTVGVELLTQTRAIKKHTLDLQYFL